MLLRDLPSDSDGRFAVPLFSLFARHVRRSLLMILADLNRTPPFDFIHQHLIRPFARHWVALAVRSGIVTEPHAQNLHLEVDLNAVPTGRFVHRDLEDLSVDFAFRRSVGASCKKIGEFSLVRR